MAVNVGSSLPPQVEGQLRCFLSVKVKRLEWSIPKPPKDVQACVLWWGEKGKGSLLRPEVYGDPSYEASNKVSEVHFPIRCGPKQFHAYVQDMGLLHFNIVYGPMQVKFARVDVKNIGELRANNPIHSIYPVDCVVAPYNSKQVGTLCVSILFKTISDAYNVSSSIVPTTDKEFPTPRTPDNKKKQHQKKKVKKKGDVTSHKHVHISEKSPERINYTQNAQWNSDADFVIGPGAQQTGHHGDKFEANTEENLPNNGKIKDTNASNTVPSSSNWDCTDNDKEGNEEVQLLQPFIPNAFVNDERSTTNEEDIDNVQPVILQGSDANTILSGLLEKGQRLKNNMIKSSIESQAVRMEPDKYPCTGEFLEKIKNMESAAVDLLLGDKEIAGDLFSKFSVSSESMGESCSELGDPLHDSSLLSELFYTTKKDKKEDESSIIFTDDEKTETSFSILKQNNKHVDNRNSTMVDGDDTQKASPDNSAMSIDLSFEQKHSYKTFSGKNATVRTFENPIKHTSSSKVTVPVRIRARAEKMTDTGGPVVITPSKSTKPQEVDIQEEKIGDLQVPLPVVSSGRSLQNLLLISEGKDILTQQPNKNCNVFCISRVFWSKEIGRTNICWDSNNPLFQFQEITHITLCRDTLHKMKNNMMVIEVWSKSTSTAKDKLVGLCKVALNQYYVSFNNTQLTETILNSQYPVIATDDWLPIIDILSGKSQGFLKILHAIGTYDQIMQLVALKGTSRLPALRENNFRQRNTVLENRDHGSRYCIEHNIEITIEGVNGVFENSDEVWGESDCYVQYYFPRQSKELSGDIKTTCFKSKTSLCVPNLVFNHMNTHSFVLAKTTPIHNVLMKKHDGDNEVSFELWKRQYYPNVRDQFVAKACLPFPKLCAMITMHRNDNVSSQSFHLPLNSLDVSGNDNVQTSGNLGLFVSYRNRATTAFESEVVNYVSFSVSVLKLCGLKGCASHLINSKIPRSGLNCYVVFYFSFMGKETARQTHTVVRSFAPVFSYHTEYSLPLYQTLDGKTISLAERIENGFLCCEVYHSPNNDKAIDEIIAEGKVPLSHILSRSSKLKKWFVLTSNKRAHTEHSSCGIQVEMQFTNSDDRKLVVNTGRGYGWCSNTSVELNDEAWLSSAYATDCNACQLDVLIEKVWVPSHVMDSLFPYAVQLKRPALYMYARYKFYDKAPIVTQPCIIQRCKDGCVCTLNHRKHFEVSSTTSFAWYLHEETLEVQYWMTSSTTTTLQQTDTLIGSSYMALNELSHSPYESHSISDCCHLFKSDSEEICDVKARVLILFNHHDNVEMDTQTNRACQDDVVFSTCSNRDLHVIDRRKEDNKNNADLDAKPSEKNDPCKPLNDITNTLDDSTRTNISVHIDEALHLPKYQRGQEYYQPEVYVSYHIPPANVAFTNIIKSVKPKWNFRMENSKVDIAVLKEKRVEFKVWRAVGDEVCVEKDLVIGVAEVDTSLLFYGLKQINGWYNIYDFNRWTVGQIKIGIFPSIVLSPSRSAKFFKQHEFMEPVNLEHVFFSNKFEGQPEHKQQSTIDDNTSRSMLFEKLKVHLDDLSNMTNKMKICSQATVPVRDIVFQKPPERDEVSICSDEPNKEIKNNEEVTKNITGENILSIGTYNTHASTVHEKSDSLIQHGIVSNDFTDINEEIQTVQNIHTEQHKGVHNICVDDMRSEDDFVSTSCRSEDELNDSTDELLEHLRDFEKKYKHLKQIVQNDSDFEDSEEEDKSKEESSKKDDSPFQSPRDVESLNEENDRKETFTFDCDVVNVSSGEQTKEDLQVTSRSHATDSEKDHVVDDNSEDQIVAQCDEPPRSEQPVSFEIKRNKADSKLDLPNFFMKPQEMAQSMKALRLAANFRRSPRQRSASGLSCTNTVDSDVSSKSDFGANDNAAKPMDRALSPTKSELQDKLRKQLPVEASEMARIESIFSSNTKVKI